VLNFSLLIGIFAKLSNFERFINKDFSKSSSFS